LCQGRIAEPVVASGKDFLRGTSKLIDEIVEVLWHIADAFLVADRWCGAGEALCFCTDAAGFGVGVNKLAEVEGVGYGDTLDVFDVDFLCVCADEGTDDECQGEELSHGVCAILYNNVWGGGSRRLQKQ